MRRHPPGPPDPLRAASPPVGPAAPVRPLVAGAAGLAGAVGYLGVESAAQRLWIFTGFGLVAVVVVALALWWNRPLCRVPWGLFVTAMFCLVTAPLARPVAATAGAAAMAALNLLTAAGYICAVTGVLLLVKGHGRADRAARLDSVMVAIGAGTFTVLELSFPVLRQPRAGSGWEAALEAMYPLYDVALIVALLLLGFTAALRLPAFRTLGGCLLFLLLGDVLNALFRSGGVGLGSPWLDLPFFAATTLFVMTTLNPSVRYLGLPPAGPSRPTGSGSDWTSRRMALFVPALVLPAVLLLVRPRSAAELAVIGGAMSSALLILLVRARSALRDVRHEREHDSLTGLLTRDAFVELLGRRLTGRDGGPQSWVVVVDLDGHQHAVQFWGHSTGDALVELAADRLSAALPPSAPLARVSADVFAALLTGARQDVTATAERLRAAVGARVDVDGLELTCTASVGLAPAGAAGDPLEAVRDADTAMNAARDLGGNRVCVFEPQMRAQTERRAALEQALRYAAGSGELSVVYQPVVDLPTGRVVGAEALLRWTSPEFGTVPPLEFVQIAEETGIIEDLGSWVLSQACRRLARWDATGLVPGDFTMAVNVSTRQLRDDALPDRLREVLRETGLAPERVVLEVTESAMHEDQQAFIAVLRTLRGIGVQISIDDFGTGYSSLSYLSRLPATSVKLDRSLVRDVAVPPGDAIARAVQGIAQALGLTVVAEGVEDEKQREALNALHIAHAQGYLWGRPVPPKDFLALVAPTAPDRPARQPTA